MPIDLSTVFSEALVVKSLSLDRQSHGAMQKFIILPDLSPGETSPAASLPLRW